MPVKHGIAAFIIKLKEAKIKADAIPVQIHHVHIETQQLKDNNKTTTVGGAFWTYQYNHSTTSTHRVRLDKA